MISKELFVKTMESIHAQQEKNRRFAKAINDMCMSSVVFDGNNLYLQSLLAILESVFDDEYEYIRWWLWEDVEKVVRLDGEEMDVSTPEQIYDFLLLVKDRD